MAEGNSEVPINVATLSKPQETKENYWPTKRENRPSNYEPTQQPPEITTSPQKDIGEEIINLPDFQPGSKPYRSVEYKPEGNYSEQQVKVRAQNGEIISGYALINEKGQVVYLLPDLGGGALLSLDREREEKKRAIVEKWKNLDTILEEIKNKNVNTYDEAAQTYVTQFHEALERLSFFERLSYLDRVIMDWGIRIRAMDKQQDRAQPIDQKAMDYLINWSKLPLGQRQQYYERLHPEVRVLYSLTREEYLNKAKKLLDQSYEQISGDYYNGALKQFAELLDWNRQDLNEAASQAEIVITETTRDTLRKQPPSDIQTELEILSELSQKDWEETIKAEAAAKKKLQEDNKAQERDQEKSAKEAIKQAQETNKQARKQAKEKENQRKQEEKQRRIEEEKNRKERDLKTKFQKRFGSDEMGEFLWKCYCSNKVHGRTIQEDVETIIEHFVSTATTTAAGESLKRNLLNRLAEYNEFTATLAERASPRYQSDLYQAHRKREQERFEELLGTPIIIGEVKDPTTGENKEQSTSVLGEYLVFTQKTRLKTEDIIKMAEKIIEDEIKKISSGADKARVHKELLEQLSVFLYFRKYNRIKGERKTVDTIEAILEELSGSKK